MTRHQASKPRKMTRMGIMGVDTAAVAAVAAHPVAGPAIHLEVTAHSEVAAMGHLTVAAAAHPEVGATGHLTVGAAAHPAGAAATHMGVSLVLMATLYDYRSSSTPQRMNASTSLALLEQFKVGPMNPENPEYQVQIHAILDITLPRDHLQLRKSHAVLGLLAHEETVFCRSGVVRIGFD
ncbi:hypothetical protein B0H14DRAFT_1500792 [Mycena olivaceomarginata]|nr:hypothetical protein B0H14DRAFT_1500792 [Mycena olivaceomarginata]